MKRLIISVICIVCIIASSITLSSITVNKSNILINLFEKAINCVQNNDYEQAHDIINQINDRLYKDTEFMSIFLFHQDVYPIENSTSLLYFLLENNDLSEFIEECQVSITQLNHIIETQKPSISNII